jgi:hypothetical protein
MAISLAVLLWKGFCGEQHGRAQGPMKLDRPVWMRWMRARRLPIGTYLRQRAVSHDAPPHNPLLRPVCEHWITQSQRQEPCLKDAYHPAEVHAQYEIAGKSLGHPIQQCLGSVTSESCDRAQHVSA